MESILSGEEEGSQDIPKAFHHLRMSGKQNNLILLCGRLVGEDKGHWQRNQVGRFWKPGRHAEVRGV